MTECTCRGGNPNCYRCGGWGLLDRIGEGRASAGPAGARKQPATKPNRSRVKKKPNANVRERPTVLTTQQCPRCGCAVKKLSRHIAKVHFDGNPNVAHKMSPDEATSCPICGVPVKKIRLVKHLARVHNSNLKPTIGSAIPHEAKLVRNQPRTNSTGKTDNSATTCAENEHCSPDASRHYANNFRDHGQFGSFPSHDDYSDESTS